MAKQSKSWICPSIRFTRVRKVKSPTRANKGDAGIDFYVPEDLDMVEFATKNPGNGYNITSFSAYIKTLSIKPHSRVLIPSGVKVLIEPMNSMLQANNKSGVSTKKGLIFSAEVVDSPYTGEVHIGVINTTDKPVYINAGEKLIQFIHIPIFLDDLEEIPQDVYNQMAENWGTRGDNGFGSSDEKEKMDILTGVVSYEEELAIRDAQCS